jgi:hypothetical protein
VYRQGQIWSDLDDGGQGHVCSCLPGVRRIAQFFIGFFFSFLFV